METLYPSIAEHEGFYNLDSGTFRRQIIESGDDTVTNHQTASYIPLLTSQEFHAAVAATYQCFWHQAMRAGLTLEQAKSLYSFSVHGEMSDRTLQVLLPDPRITTAQFVASIQAEVLSMHPLWRVLIRCADNCRTVIVYPNAVRVGNTPSDADWEQELAQAMEKEVEYIEKTKGHYHRQLRFLSDRIQPALRELSGRPFLLMAVFDNYNGDATEWTIWLLFSGNNSEDITVVYSAGVSSSYEFPVRSDGYFGPLYDSSVAGYWLRAWAYPANSSKMIVRQQKDFQPIPGMQYEITIRPEDVVRDADLQRLGGLNTRSL